MHCCCVDAVLMAGAARCTPGGQGCFFCRFFLGGAGSSLPASRAAAACAAASASVADFSAAASLSLQQTTASREVI